MTVGSDNPFPSVLFAEHVDPSNPGAGTQRLFVDTDHVLKLIDSAGTVTTYTGASGAVATDAIWDAAGDLAQGTGANTGAKLTIGSTGQVLTVVGGSAAWATKSTTFVEQDISADFATSNDSAWHDITGLTGISLTAGTWIATLDIDHRCTVNYGPVFRIWDGTTTYVQAGLLVNFLAAITSHFVMHSKPFVLSGSATMACQVFSDTVFTITKYPTRGGLSSAVATHVTFLRVA